MAVATLSPHEPERNAHPGATFVSLEQLQAMMQTFGTQIEERFAERLETQKTELQAEIEQARANHAEEVGRLETELETVQTERNQEKQRANIAETKNSYLEDALKAAKMEKWYWVVPMISSYLTWGTILHLGFDICMGVVGAVVIGATAYGLVYLLETFVLPWWEGPAPQPAANHAAEANNHNEKAEPIKAPLPSRPTGRFLNWSMKLRSTLPSRFGTWLVGIDSSVTRMEA